MLPARIRDEFDRAMQGLGPFEPRPYLAVAVSGGADSLALLLLARAWAAARGGRVAALTVDHGLRAEAAAEAASLGRWLGTLDVTHHTLRWAGDKPSSDIQSSARDARYRLLAAWCAAAPCLHLLAGHQRDDAAENLLLRLARGSGLFGLAATPAEVSLGPVRLLRPLLTLSRASLASALGPQVPVIEDPSNAVPRYARSRMRAASGDLAPLGLTGERLAGAAAQLARARRAIEAAAAALHLTAVRLHPAGFALVDPAPLAEAPAEVALRLLADLLAAIGGHEHGPRLHGLERLHGRLTAYGRQASGARLEISCTLSGCRVIARASSVLICREAAACAPPLVIRRGAITSLLYWDGRFLIRQTAALDRDWIWGPLGGQTAIARDFHGPLLPGAVLPALPALFDDDGLAAVPHLGYERVVGSLAQFCLWWRPQRIGRSGRYTVV